MKQERSGKNWQFQMYRWSKYIFNSLQYLLRMLNMSNYSEVMQTGTILGTCSIFTNKRRIPQMKGMRYLLQEKRRIPKMQGMRYLLQEKRRIPKMQGMRYLLQEKRRISLKCKELDTYCKKRGGYLKCKE